MEFKDRFNELLGEERGAGQRLSKAIGASSGVINGWKTGEKKPSLDYIIMLAEYFSVTTDYLLCVAKESEKAPTLELSEDEREMLELFQKIPYKDQQRLIWRLQQVVSPLSAFSLSDSMGEEPAPPATGAGKSSSAKAV